MKKISCFILITISLGALFSSYKKIDHVHHKTGGTARWTGTITYEEITIISSPVMNVKSERHAVVSFSDALPTMNRDDGTIDLNFKDDKGTGNYTFHSEGTAMGVTGTTDCSGGGESELHSVVINEETKTYDIEAISPLCKGTKTSSDGGSTDYGPESISIIVSDKPLGTTKNILNGTQTLTAELPDSLGTATTTITWSLSSVSGDAELIVAPEQYNDWLPKPGMDESNKGSVMTINLKLQGKNGKPLNVKADSFVLRLSNTSREPGITINYPVYPDDDQLPDLRLILDPRMESIEEDQYISVGSPDGSTGKAYIASYDGGGWTTLTAEAVLKDHRHIKGHLLLSTGPENIPVPQRAPGSKIALAWYNAHGNPKDLEDKESSRDNSFKGDGFTVYEEYRGVISEGKFKRLDPVKKEIGVVATQKDFSLFSEGIGWFKNASDLDVIRFDIKKEEAAPGVPINGNCKAAHYFDQFAVHLLDGGLGRDGTLGNTSCANKLFIPANIDKVVIDYDYVQILHKKLVDSAKPEALKFTVKEYLAQTVAHELGHSVNIDHHGVDHYNGSYDITEVSDQIRIFDRNGNLIIKRPLLIKGIGDSLNTVESGVMSCMINYYPFYHWGLTIGADGATIFNKEPLLPLGRVFCTSKNGTGVNATKLYFGNAKNGDCMSQIQLRN
ncbi:MAG: hypothetical protein ABIT05_09600 [Chitinophagaceae bacterium]